MDQNHFLSAWSVTRPSILSTSLLSLYHNIQLGFIVQLRFATSSHVANNPLHCSITTTVNTSVYFHFEVYQPGQTNQTHLRVKGFESLKLDSILGISVAPLIQPWPLLGPRRQGVNFPNWAQIVNSCCEWTWRNSAHHCWRQPKHG